MIYRYLLLVILMLGCIEMAHSQNSKYILNVKDSTQDTMFYTNEYAAFYHKIIKLKQTELKRREIRPKEKKDTITVGQRKRPLRKNRKYYIPSKGIDEYLLLFDKLVITRDVSTLQCYYKEAKRGFEPYLVVSPLPIDSLEQAGTLTTQWLESNAAGQYVIPAEDSPMAYFQYLVFHIYGEKFASYWREDYGYRIILLTHPDEEPKTIANLVFKGETVNEQLYEKGRGEAILPIMTMDEKYCKFILYEENSKHINHVTYQICREKPWTIERTEEHHVVQKPDLNVR